MCKICGQENHTSMNCWMRHVVLDDKEWTNDNMGSPLQIDLSKVIKSPVINIKNQDCPICMENIEETNSAVTSCGHCFCLSCIIKAGRTNNDCPLCRQALTDNNVVRRLFQIPRLDIEQINRNALENDNEEVPRGRELFARLFLNRRN